MNRSRRRFLQSSLATMMVAGCKSEKKEENPSITEDTGEESFLPESSATRSEEPESWIPEEEWDAQIFPLPLRVGDVLSDSAILCIHSTENSLSLQVMKAVHMEWVEAQRIDDLLVSRGFLRVSLDSLQADTAYCLAFFYENSRSMVTRFRTALAENESRIITFGATSCFGGNRPWPSLSQAAKKDYDFFCFLGDLVYADNANVFEEYWSYYEYALGQKGLQDLFSSTSVISTWDDHEVGNNWSWEQIGIETKLQEAFSAFQKALPLRLGSQGLGIWRKMSWGQSLDVFVLDCRSERKDGNYISTAQMEWLKEGLVSSNARFKIILNSVPIIDYNDLWADSLAEDRWQGYPLQREELLSFIETQGVEGILWIAGDFHFGQIARVGVPGALGDGMYEVLVGPSGSGPNILGDLIVPTEQYLLQFANFNYTEFTCDPVLGIVHVAFIGDDGAIIQEMSLDL